LLVESGEHNPRVLDNALMLAHSTDLNSQQDLLALWQSVFLFLRNTRKQSERHSPLFQEIDAYMRAHFRESGMSLATLADAFNVSSATISREFKKNTGTGFLECLHRLRIEAAKAEISATQTPIKDIALHVGYDNALTMTRAFKKYEGATPNTFRNLDGGA
jgi:YesN/AraC family two-component response regulator